MVLNTLKAILDEANKEDGSLDRIKEIIEGLLKHTKVGR